MEIPNRRIPIRPRARQHPQRVVVDLGVDAGGEGAAVPQHLPDLRQ